MTDQVLVQAVRHGDQEAFRQLVLPLERRYCHIAFSITGNSHDALDAWQNALLRAWTHFPRLRDPLRFRSWLATILLNECKTLVSKRRRTALPLEELPEQAEDVVDTASSLAVRECLRHLPLEQREAVVLRFWLDLSLQDIARATGVRLSAAKARLYRGIEALHDMLEDKTEGGEVDGRQS